MSERVSQSQKVRITALLVAALIAFTVLVAAFAAWLRWVSAPEVSGENAVNTEPLTSLETLPRVSEKEAEKIAIAEIEKREGWSGRADKPSREGFLWFFAVRRKPGPATDWRYITVSGGSGNILAYEIRTDPLP